jgi:ribonucleoside-diphosphate reductase alpha chain
MKIKKRNGEYEDFDIQKVKDMLSWACEGLDVNPLELETSLTVSMADGVTTKDIHQNSIQIASTLISIDEPDWRYVAGRLKMTGYVKDVTVRRGFGYGSTKQYIEYQVSRGVYDPSILMFSDDVFDYCDHLIDPEYDMLFDISGATAAVERYCLSDELPQEMLLTMALILARESSYMYETDLLNILSDAYTAFAKLQLSPSTPLLLNLRRHRPNLSSCYIIQADDDMDSIYDNIKNVAMISKNAGGVGVNLDKIRAAGSWIKKTKGASSGVIPLVKVLNDTAVYVNQEGKRAGAVSPSLSVWHLDILEFLEIQLEEGDQRTKSFDVMPQVIYNDEFMSRLEADQMWYLFDPYEVRTIIDKDLADLYGNDFNEVYTTLELMAEHGELELFKKVRARDIFKAHYKAMRISGMPYITFKDTINNNNPNKDSGVIYAANICVESFSNFEADKLAHTCNLISVNAARCIGDNHEDTLRNVASLGSLATLLLDCTIGLGNPSIKESQAHNDLYRTIGVGVLGMADYMAYYGKSYETKEGIELSAEFMEVLSMSCVSTSTNMADVAEPFKNFKDSEWAKGNLFGRDGNEFITHCKYPDLWEQLRERVITVGVRNGQLMAIAPNSSTGIFQGVSPSILPAWKLHYVETTQLGNVSRLPYFVKDRALWYKAYPQVDMDKMIDYVAAMQVFVDSGISFELVLDLNDKNKSGLKYWYHLVNKAWKSGIKTLYYTRFITEDSMEDNDTGCIACAN